MSGNNDFGGDVVLVYLVNPPDAFVGGIPIVHPVIEEKAGVTFIVGHIPPDPRDWTSEMPIGVSMKQVAHYLVFATLEDFLQKSEFLAYSESSIQ